MGISRFSKPVNPAKFNPLSAEEIMKVPQMKGALEQQQIKSIEEARFKLFNTDIAPGDKERVLKEQDRISGRFDSIIDDIRTKGVGYKTTENINSFLTDYNKSTSKVGIVGGAAEFAKQRTDERKLSREQAIKNKYDMADYSRMEQIFDAQQTSFGKDGISNDKGYQGLYLPENIDPVKMLQRHAKDFGYKQTTDKYGQQSKDNRMAIDKAIEIIQSDFTNKDSYKQLLELSGQNNAESVKEIIRQLERKGDSMLEDSYKEAPYVAPKATKATKDIKKDPENEANLLNLSEGQLRPNMYDITNEGDVAMQKLYGVESTEYQNYKFYKDKTADLFKKTDKAKALEETIAGATQDLLDNPESEAMFVSNDKTEAEIELQRLEEEAAKRDEERAANPARDQYNNKIFTNPSKKEEYILLEDSKGAYKIFDANGDAFIKVKQQQDRLGEAFKDFAGENARHFYGKEFSINESALTGSDSNKNQISKQQSILNKAIEGNDNSKVVTLIETNYDNEGKIDGDPEDLSDIEDPTNVKMTDTLKGLLANKDYTITNVRQQLGSTYNKPMVHYTLQGKDTSYQVSIEVKDLGAKQSAIVQSFSKSLGNINKETQKVAEQFAAYVAQKDIAVSYNKGSEINDGNLFSYTRTSSGQPPIMNKMQSGNRKGGATNIVANFNGFGITTVKNGVQYPLTKKELLNTLKFDFDQALTDDEWVTYIEEFSNGNMALRRFLNIEFIKMRANKKDPMLSYQEGVRRILQDDSPYNAKTKADLLSVVKR